MLARQRPLAFVPPAPTFGRLLHRFRLAAGLTQEQLAERAGTVARLAEALQLPPADRARLAAVSRSRHAPSFVEQGEPAGNRPLPTPLTSFIGREQVIATIRHLLGATRLLTLIAAPGTGKTRLALAVAATLDDATPMAWSLSRSLPSVIRRWCS